MNDVPGMDSPLPGFCDGETREVEVVRVETGREWICVTFLNLTSHGRFRLIEARESIVARVGDRGTLTFRAAGQAAGKWEFQKTGTDTGEKGGGG